MRFRNKPRYEDLLRSPNLAFMIGRLHGAAEATAHMLTLRPDEDDKATGEWLREITDWFMTSEPIPTEAFMREASTQFPRPMMQEVGKSADEEDTSDDLRGK